MPLTPELLALDLALIAFPRRRWRSAAAFAPRCICKDDPMYSLSKAKEEIDTVAKHATDIAAHVLHMSDDMNAKLDSFKAEILSIIEERFTELGRTLYGDAESVETSAVSDLGAKVSLLTRGITPRPVSSEDAPQHDPQAPHDPQARDAQQPNHGEPQHDDRQWHQGHSPDGHQPDGDQPEARHY